MGINTALSKMFIIMLTIGTLALAANISNGNISLKKGPDALTSATVKNKGEQVSLSGISGNYTVIINKERAPEGTLEYFSGVSEHPISGQIACHIPTGDKKAKDFAETTADLIKEEDALILFSKAEYGDFDILIFSKKTADIYTAKSLYDKEFTEVVEIQGE